MIIKNIIIIIIYYIRSKVHPREVCEIEEG